MYRFDKSLDDNWGITCVLVQSEILDCVLAYARMKEIDTDVACEGVREMIEPVRVNSRCGEFMTDVASMGGEELMEKWFLNTTRVKAERFARHTCERLGVYDQAKRLVKRMMEK